MSVELENIYTNGDAGELNAEWGHANLCLCLNPDVVLHVESIHRMESILQVFSLCCLLMFCQFAFYTKYPAYFYCHMAVPPKTCDRLFIESTHLYFDSLSLSTKTLQIAKARGKTRHWVWLLRFRSNHLLGRWCLILFSIDNIFPPVFYDATTDTYKQKDGWLIVHSKLLLCQSLHDLHSLCSVCPLCLHPTVAEILTSQI